jgi:hypothetical protein
MALLLNQRGDGIVVTPQLVQTLVKSFDALAMKILLTQYGAKVKITEEVVKAAARNEKSSKEVILLLLDQRGAEVKITEEVVNAVAKNWQGGKEVMAKSSMVGSLMTDVSTVGPLGADSLKVDSLVVESLISGLSAGSFGLLGLPAPLFVPCIAT